MSADEPLAYRKVSPLVSRKPSAKAHLLLLWMVLLWGVRATAGWAPAPLPTDVTMNPGAGRGEWLIVTLRLASGEELPFVVDTGSPGTVLDQSLVPKLGPRDRPFKVWTPLGTQEAGLYPAPQLYLGKVPLRTGRYVVAFDCKKMLALAQAGTMGILGMDCLANYCIQLDFEAGKVRFLSPEAVKPAELGKAFPLRLSNIGMNTNDPSKHLCIRHPGLLGGAETNVLIDTGDNIDGEVEKGVIKGHYLTRLGHLFTPARGLRFRKCVWDGDTYTKLSIGTGWNALGLSFLGRHLVTFDFPRGTMYLKKTSTGPLRAKATFSDAAPECERPQ